MIEFLKVKNRVVGMNQSVKEIQNGNGTVAYLARDADKHMVSSFEKLCKDWGVTLFYINTMKELARACSVDVPTSVAVMLRK